MKIREPKNASRRCFEMGKAVVIEWDDCFGGFHLKCLRPPLKDVPEEDWICQFCEGKRSGKEIKLHKPPAGKKMARALSEKFFLVIYGLLAIGSLRMEKDSRYWFRG